MNDVDNDADTVLPPVPLSQRRRRSVQASDPPAARSPADLAGDGLLGAALQNPQALSQLRALGLTAADFQGLPREVWKTIEKLGDSGAVTPLTVAAQSGAALNSQGGVIYLNTLVAQATPATALLDHVALVQQATHHRAVDRKVRELIKAHGQSPAALSAALHALNTVVTRPRPGSALGQTIGSIAAQALGRLNGPPQTSVIIPTGLADLDAALMVLPGQLCVLAARPGVGKTLVGLGFAQHAASLGIRTTVLSLEMTPLELGIRALASQAPCDVTQIFRAVHGHSQELSEQEHQRLAQAEKRLNSLLLSIDSQARTLEEVLAAVGSAAATGTKLLVVDHLHLVLADDGHSSETVLLGRITSRLKAAAHRHGVAIWLLAQLSRGPEIRPDHRPILSDLRQSGEIEANADIVVMLYRDGMYHPNSPDANLIELIITKNRNGPCRMVKAGWDGVHQRLVPLD